MKLIVLLLSFLILTSMKPIDEKIKFEDDCKILKAGTFIYGDNENKVKVIKKGNSHIEYYENGRFTIHSEIKWISECEYQLTLVETDIPHFNFEIGDIMTIKINKIEKNVIYYTAYSNGRSKNGILIKISNATTPI